MLSSKLLHFWLTTNSNNLRKEMIKYVSASSYLHALLESKNVE